MSTILTERLLLRQWCMADIATLAQINQDPKVMEYFPAPRSYVETESFVLANMDLCNNGEPFFFAVEEVKSSELIGFVGICKVDHNMPFAPAIEIGWRLAAKYWGQGYALEAANAVVKYAFEKLGITELVSFTVPDNVRSRKLMERLGFLHEPENIFSHPKIAADHKFSKHVLYRLISPHIKIDLLKNYPLSIPALAKIWHEVLGKIWMPEIGIAKIESGYYEELNEELPLAYVALYDGVPVGTCSLQLNGGIRPDLKPCLGDLVVDAKYQKRGIGKMLIDVAMKKTKALGFEKLYLFAFDPAIPKYYQLLGWRKIGMDEFNYLPVTVMEISI